MIVVVVDIVVAVCVCADCTIESVAGWRIDERLNEDVDEKEGLANAK